MNKQRHRFKTNPKKNARARRKRADDVPTLRQVVKPSRSKYVPHVGKKQLAKLES